MKIKCLGPWAAAMMALCVAGEVAASADEQKPVVERLLDIMRANGSINEEQHEELLRQARQEQDAAAAAAEEIAQAQPENKFTVKAGYDGLRVASADGAFKFGVGGRLQADFAVFDEDITPLGDGVEIRRARLKAQGTVLSDWQYKLEVNFDTNGETSITDAWISYTPLEPFGVPVRVTAGHLKVPFSQQSMTSSNWQVFQERAMVDALLDNPVTGRRRMGGLLESYGEHWFAAVGGFAAGVDDFGTANEGWGVAGRVGVLPFIEERKTLSINGAVYYRDVRNDTSLQYRARPEAHIAGTRLVDTGALMSLDDLLLYNISATGVWGSFHAQGEYTGAHVGRRAGSSDLYLNGWYLQAGYFLTGESRRYDNRYGKYRRLTPKRSLGEGGYGAFEVAARFSAINLQDEDIRGGKEWNVTAALNWYVNPSIMFRLNYVYANPDPNSSETLGGVNEHINIVEGRMQVVF